MAFACSSRAFGSGLGTWLAFVALTVDVWDHASSNWVAALLIADFLPAIALGLTVGPLIDRYLAAARDGRRRHRPLRRLLRAPVREQPGQIVAGRGRGLATGFFRPAVYAGLPNLVKDEELPSAQGLLQAADAMTTVLGPLAGGVLVAATSPDWAYAINAVTFLFSAALILRIRRSCCRWPRPRPGALARRRRGLKLIGGSRACSGAHRLERGACSGTRA